MSAPDWFVEVKTDTPHEQGIIIKDFEWFDFKSLSALRSEDGSSTELPTLLNHVIILTQACDLLKPTTQYVHVCPIYTLGDFFRSQNRTTQKGKQKLFDELSKHSVISKHLTNTFNLKGHSELKGDYLVVDFSRAMIVPMAYVKAIMKSGKASSYPMLNIPYRESMAQRYGQFFSRVGNPINLDSFEASKHNK